MLRRSFLGSLATLSAGKLRAEAPAHPRLFFDAKRLELLRQRIGTTHAALWQAVRRAADSFLRSGPPAYTPLTGPDDQQLWQREVGNKLPFLAISYLLTPEMTPYLDAAVKWSLACCSYPQWGSRDGIDLPAGHQLFGLALVYDWLYKDMPRDARDTIHSALVARGRVMYQAAVKNAYWRDDYLQNHLWVNITGLFAVALSLDDEPEAKDWIKLVREKMRATEAALGPDGASHEGVGYWSYGAEYMLKYWHMAADLFGEKPSSPWWKHTASYRMYLGQPRNWWNKRYTIVDIGDCQRFDWYGPEYLLRRLAAMYHDPHAQWLAAELERADVTAYAARWLNLLWYDPAVEPRPASDLPTMRHFEDMGIVSARSGWSGDESLVVFKCGPPIGHEATDKFDTDPGASHVHPDANHFVVFGAGGWLLRDDGYSWKQTDQHNTLLVDGAGQMGENAQWFRGYDMIRARIHPRVLQADSTPDVDRMAGDATAIYPARAGLRRFVRRLVFLKPDVLIVVDDIETDRARSLELRFHPQNAFDRAPDGALLTRGKRPMLRLELLTPEGVETTFGETPAKDHEGKPARLQAAVFKTQAAKWRNAVALSWSPAGTEPVRVTLERKAGVWTFRAGGRTASV
jgi:hypothetical protein